MPLVPIAGLVMAGGHSSRMGMDKARLRPHAWRHDFLELAYRKLSALVRPCHVSCAMGRAYAGYPCITDKIPDCGPAAGILAGLDACAARGIENLLVLACDMPMINSEILQNLLKTFVAATGAPLLTVYQSECTGRLEMLAAIYTAGCRPLLQNALDSGRGSLRQIIPRQDQLRIQYPGHIAPCFMNCNTPHDLELLPPEL